MQRFKPLTESTEIRITYNELMLRLRDQHEFLWHFAQKMARCKRCKNEAPEEGPYRIYVNGHGDFAVYHRCGECSYPLHAYVDLSQERDVRRAMRKLWLTKFN